MVYVAALLIGIACGARTTYALAFLSWAARLHRIHLEGTLFAFLGYRATPYLLTLIALNEFRLDKLPTTASRLIPQQFISRVVAGSVCGAIVGTTGHMLVAGLFLGMAGSVGGTLGGARARSIAAGLFGKDLPAALFEDVLTLALCTLSAHLSN